MREKSGKNEAMLCYIYAINIYCISWTTTLYNIDICYKKIKKQ